MTFAQNKEQKTRIFNISIN